MSTIVTNSSPLSITTGSPPNDWKDISNLIDPNNDNNEVYSYYEFATGSNPSSEIYISDWQFSLPVDSVVDEITLVIDRKQGGSGTVTDSEIRLYFPTSEVFDLSDLTINYALGTGWPTSDSSQQYTGTWNKAWTEEEINSSLFGCWIKVNSDTTTTTAFIDRTAIKVTYHQDITVNGDGGCSCGGSADVNLVDVYEPSGGVVIAGEAIGPYIFPNYNGIGGVLSAGSAELKTEVLAFGGVVVGGSIKEIENRVPEGGAVLGGESTIEFIDQVENIFGGSILGGSAIVSSGIFGIGGVIVAGNSTITVENNIDGTGGIVVGDEAIINPFVAEGGATLGGSLEETVIWDGASEFGGVVTGGLSLLTSEEQTQGGVTLGGISTPIRVITIPDWDLYLEGSQVVPPIDSTATAHAEFWYDSTERNLSWRITYSGFEDPVTVARLRQGQPGETGDLKLDLFEYIESNTGSEITGMAQIDTSLESDLLSGNLYLMFGCQNGVKIRTQFWHYGASLGGEASVEPYYEIPKGGIVLGGEALVDPIWGEGGAVLGGAAIAPFIDEYIPEGGIVIGGVSAISGNPIDATGGILLGGEATVVQIEGSITTSGGVVISGEASENRILDETGNGGIVCGGTSTIEYIVEIVTNGGVLTNGTAIEQAVFEKIGSGGTVIAGISPTGIGIFGSGGIVVEGTFDQSYISNPVIIGGVIASGVAAQTFFDYFDGSGGVRVSGRTIADKIKFYTEYKTGYCRALKSDNICKVEDQSEQLLRPPGDQEAELDPNRFRIEYLPTWCELDEKLQPYRRITQPKDCDAALAIVIKKRQKGVIPPKSGRAQIRDRGIAFSDTL